MLPPALLPPDPSSNLVLTLALILTTNPTPTPTQLAGNANLHSDAGSLMAASNSVASTTDGSAAFLQRYRHGGKAEPKDRAIKTAGRGAALTDKFGNLI